MAGPDPDGARFAVYFAPAADSAWGMFGQRWFAGAYRSAGVGEDRWQGMLQVPRRYGWHATLKAPFRLAAGVSESELIQRVTRLAGQLQAVPLGELSLQHFDGFVALATRSTPPALQALADRCVGDLDDLRAPLLPQEWARRQPQQLDERARALLQRYGYPHVLERFRYHMTLAMVDGPGQAAAVMACARSPVEALNRREGALLDRLCVFAEPRPGAAFQRRCDCMLLPAVRS